jgi:GTP1/Obg family GTP-binding protein
LGKAITTLLSKLDLVVSGLYVLVNAAHVHIHCAASVQVIDTPGILDHPLEDRNTIEMLAITALAHLRAAVLFVLDLSGTCGYTIAQQSALFHSIKPLFANKPLMIACNKTDLQVSFRVDKRSLS